MNKFCAIVSAGSIVSEITTIVDTLPPQNLSTFIHPKTPNCIGSRKAKYIYLVAFRNLKFDKICQMNKTRVLTMTIK